MLINSVKVDTVSNLKIIEKLKEKQTNKQNQCKTKQNKNLQQQKLNKKQKLLL